MQLEQKIEEFTKRTTELWQRVQQYTIPLDNLSVLQGVSFKAAIIQYPFSQVMKALEGDLELLHTSLLGGNVNDIYRHVEPVFRMQEVYRRELRGLPDLDSISLYMHEHQTMVMWNACGKKGDIVVSYKELFLKTLLNESFVNHLFFKKELLEHGGEEAIAYSRDFLKNVQLLYQFDVQSVTECYYNLLLDIHHELAKHTSKLPLFTLIPPRRLPRLDESTISNFVSEQSLSPNSIIEQGILTEIRRHKEFYGNGELALIGMLSISSDWGGLLEDVVGYTHTRNKDPIEKYKIFEPGGDLIVPVEIEHAERRHVIGQDDNLSRLYDLLSAFAQGNQIPNIVLRGETGTGKSLSMKAIVNEIEGLKMVMLDSNYLGALGQYAERMAEKPWYTILYIDDMEFNSMQFEGFKTGTQGMKRFPKNVAIVASVNSESFDRLPEAVKRRFPVVLNYNRLHLSDVGIREKVFEANASLIGMRYDPELEIQFPNRFGKTFQEATPADVYAFLVEMKPKGK